jgi:hypothetical protein
LVVGVPFTCRDRDGLPVGLGKELRRANIRNPDLHRS